MIELIMIISLKIVADGCKHIDEVKLVSCKKVSDVGLPMLSYLKDSLLHLEIRDCKAITHVSLNKLSDLQ